MPNGRHDWNEVERPALDRFFAPIADALNRFAAENGVKFDPYWHQLPLWRMDFRHPQGGVAGILVERTPDDHVSISIVWWLDVFQEETRYSRKAELGLFEREGSTVAAELARGLATLLSWPFGEWPEAHGSMDWKKWFTRATFEQASVGAFPPLVPRRSPGRPWLRFSQQRERDTVRPADEHG